MNERFDKWLDEQLKKTVDSGRVEFDAGRWKQKYADEYQAIVSRTAVRGGNLRFLWGRRLARIAAIIAVAVLAIFFMHRQPDKSIKPQITARPERSPAAMLSCMSLMRAYERGGLDAVDEQCEKAFKLLGKKTTKISISVNELLNENGKESERKDL